MEDLHFYSFVKVPCLQAEYNQTLFSILNPFTADRNLLYYSSMVHLWMMGGKLLLTVIGSSKHFSILKCVLSPSPLCLSLLSLGLLVRVVCYRCNTLLTELTLSSCQHYRSLSHPHCSIYRPRAKTF